MRTLKIASSIMFLLAILYILGILFIPWMAPLKSDIFAWIIFGIYLLILVFVRGLAKGHRYETMSEQENANIKETQEILKERSKWYR